MKKNKLNYKIISLLVVGLLMPVVAGAINTVETGYKLAPGETKKIDAHGTCMRVINNSNNPDFDTLKTFFIPTKTSNEWKSFRQNRPEEVAINPCPVPIVTPVPTSSSGPDIYYHYYRGEEFDEFWD